MGMSFDQVIPSVEVIDKTIVYSDTVLPLNDIGNNLAVTKIENVSENDLENCLTIIFIENYQATFNKVQYSRGNKTVYFYTNEKINTDSYEKSKFRKHGPIHPHERMILEEIKHVFESENNNDYNCISLYDVLILLKKLDTECENMRKYFNNILEYITNNKISRYSSIVLYEFDFINKLLRYWI